LTHSGCPPSRCHATFLGKSRLVAQHPTLPPIRTCEIPFIVVGSPKPCRPHRCRLPKGRSSLFGSSRSLVPGARATELVSHDGGGAVGGGSTARDNRERQKQLLVVYKLKIYLAPLEAGEEPRAVWERKGESPPRWPGGTGCSRCPCGASGRPLTDDCPQVRPALSGQLCRRRIVGRCFFGFPHCRSLPIQITIALQLGPGHSAARNTTVASASFAA